MSTAKNYLSLIKFSHTIFAMPFAMIGFCLGMYPHIDSDFSVGQWNLGKTIGWGWDITNFVFWTPILKKLVLVMLKIRVPPYEKFLLVLLKQTAR